MTHKRTIDNSRATDALYSTYSAYRRAILQRVKNHKENFTTRSLHQILVTGMLYRRLPRRSGVESVSKHVVRAGSRPSGRGAAFSCQCCQQFVCRRGISAASRGDGRRRRRTGNSIPDVLKRCIIIPRRPTEAGKQLEKLATFAHLPHDDVNTEHRQLDDVTAKISNDFCARKNFHHKLELFQTRAKPQQEVLPLRPIRSAAAAARRLCNKKFLFSSYDVHMRRTFC